VILPDISYFQVKAMPDTICHGDTTAISIQAKDKDDNDLEMPPETMVVFELDSRDQSFGHLMDYDITGVTYQYAREGNVQYVADGDTIDGAIKAQVKVYQKDDPDMQGEGVVNIVTTGLKIIAPNTEADEDTIWISDVPQMPEYICKGKLSGYDGDVTFEWKCKVEYQLQTRNGDTTFTETIELLNPDTVKWTFDFNDGSKFIGGEATVYLKAITPEKTYIDSVADKLVVLGENPSVADVKNGMTTEMQVIIYKESYPKWKHFYISGTRLGYPIYGQPNGYGLMQLDTPRPTETQLWNWRENRAGGIFLFNEKYNWGLSYPQRLRNQAMNGELDPCYLNVTDFATQEQILKEAFQLYNGRHQWIWQPDGAPEDPNSGGEWVPNPARSGYGDEAWEIYTNVINGNPPQNWNKKSQGVTNDNKSQPY